MIPANSMGPPAGIAGIPHTTAPRLLFLLTTEKKFGGPGARRNRSRGPQLHSATAKHAGRGAV
jgi:hypothetical protein